MHNLVEGPPLALTSGRSGGRRDTHADQVDSQVAVEQITGPAVPAPSPPRLGGRADASIMFAVAWPKPYISQSRWLGFSDSLTTSAIVEVDWAMRRRRRSRISALAA